MVDPSCADLATKAELQELRNQLNTILGKSADGTGNKDIFTQGSLAGTAIETSLGYANTAMQDIAIPAGSEDDILTAIAVGSAVFQKQVGNGTKVVLENLGKATKGLGKAAKAIPAMVAGTKISAEVSTVTMALVTQAFQTFFTVKTLDLIKLNTANQDAQWNAYNRDFTNLIQLLGRANGDIAKANEINAENKETIEEQKRVNEIQAQQIAVANVDITHLVDTNRNQNEVIRKNRAAFDAFKAEVAQVQEANQEAFDELDAFAELLAGQLLQAEELIADQAEKLEALQTQVADLEAKVVEQQQQIDALQQFAFATDRRLFYLELSVAQGLEGFDERLDDFEGEIAKTTIMARQRSTGSTGATATRESASTQNKLLDFISRLTGQGSYDAGITDTKIYNGVNDFEDQYADLTSTLGEEGIMNREDLNDWGDTFGDVITAGVIGGIATNWGSTWTSIKNQTSATNIAAAAATGTCEAAKPGGCMQTNLTDPLKQKLDQLFNAAGMSFSAANYFLLTSPYSGLAAIKTVTDTINGTVNAIQGVVTHAQHGLEAVQNFASKAWEATHADKVLSAITTAMVIHNGVQLSTNILATVGETASIILDAVGVKDSTGNLVDVNAWFKTKLTSMLESLLGGSVYAALTERIAKYNRIYQASANVLNAATDLFDSARSTAELTAENTGKIGNALLESGVVVEDSYRRMVDKVSPQSRALSRIEGFRDKLDTIEDGVSTIGNIAQEVVGTKDAYRELLEARDGWKEVNESEVQLKETATEEAKKESTVNPEIDKLDFSKDETEDTTP